MIAVCPISVRTEDEEGSHGNKVSAMFTSLATDIDDPVERLRAIVSVTDGAKREHNALGARMLTDWGEFAAPVTFGLASRLYSSMRLADRHRPIHNLVVSNVPGPPFSLYLAGAELVAAYPMGPIMEGAGLNATVLSYRDSIDFGFMAVPGADARRVGPRPGRAARVRRAPHGCGNGTPRPGRSRDDRAARGDALGDGELTTPSLTDPPKAPGFRRSSASCGAVTTTGQLAFRTT